MAGDWMREIHYILDGHAVRAVGAVEHARWWARYRHEHDGRPPRVCQTTLPDGRWLSTVFLSIDHNYSGAGPPVLFETMLFDSYDDLTERYCERYATWAEAEAGHAAVLERLRPGTPLDADARETSDGR